MEVRFRDVEYSTLEVDPKCFGKWPAAIVKAYRNRLNFIRQASDERDLYIWKSLRFERLKGERTNQFSLRLNDQFRLVLEIDGESPKKTIMVVEIEDYH